MLSLHYEKSGFVAASPDRLFAHLDDHTRLSAHMSEPSWKMGGGKMELQLDEQKGRAVGSRIRLAGRVFGIGLFVEERVTERASPYRKVWETVGTPRLLLIGGYRLGFDVKPSDDGSMLRVFIGTRCRRTDCRGGSVCSSASTTRSGARIKCSMMHGPISHQHKRRRVRAVPVLRHEMLFLRLTL